MNKERIKYLQEQTAIIRSYSEPLYAEQNEMIIEAWEAGESIDDIAEALNWKTKSVTTRLTTLGIDWRNEDNRVIYKEVEPEFKLNYK